MSNHSMTGFARVQGGEAGYSWSWEVRATNGRNLDVRTRVPAGFEHLEPAIREHVQARLNRGNIGITLQCRRDGGMGMPVVNEAALKEIMRTACRLEDELGFAAPRIDGLLNIKGIVEMVEPDEDPKVTEKRDDSLLRDLDKSLEDLVTMRATEGRELTQVLTGALRALDQQAKGARDSAAAQPEAIRERFAARLDEFLAERADISQERLAQETAILAAKADVREELDRLKAHIDAAENLLTEGGAVGRQLDFLAQEMNRETNTLCAKSGSAQLTQAGLAMKTLIDQIREQAQNLE